MWFLYLSYYGPASNLHSIFNFMPTILLLYVINQHLKTEHLVRIKFKWQKITNKKFKRFLFNIEPDMIGESSPDIHDLPKPTAAFFPFRVSIFSGLGSPVLSSYFFSKDCKSSQH